MFYFCVFCVSKESSEQLQKNGKYLEGDQIRNHAKGSRPKAHRGTAEPSYGERLLFAWQTLCAVKSLQRGGNIMQRAAAFHMKQGESYKTCHELDIVFARDTFPDGIWIGRRKSRRAFCLRRLQWIPFEFVGDKSMLQRLLDIVYLL